MKLESGSLRSNERIPRQNAMGVPGEAGPEPGPNKSPELAWSGFPAGTRSFALLCVDPDAPQNKDDANKPDRKIPQAAPRGDFYHWILVDIPPSLTRLVEGADSDGITPKGKPSGKTDHGTRGINSYKEWFGDDPDMGGDYGGYDGPWPPFNDERVHRYVFTVYALGVPSLGLGERARGPEALKAMRGKILDQASLTLTYALNPSAQPPP